MTALPLVWGEGNPADVLTGRSSRSETLKIIDRRIDVRAIDTVSAATLQRDVALIAQPRRLTPNELVAFDKWVQRGGRAMIFADPELVWPSVHAPGDNRRAPPVTLLDPLFAHWGVTLGDSDREERTMRLGGSLVTMLAAGAWQGPKSCAAIAPELMDCRIGRGRVLLVGDADILDARLWQASGADNAAWITVQLEMLGGAARVDSTRGSGAVIAAIAVAATLIVAGIYRRIRRT